MTTEKLQPSADDQTIDNEDQNINTDDQTIDNEDQNLNSDDKSEAQISDEVREKIIADAIEAGRVVDYETRFRPIYGSLKHTERELAAAKKGTPSDDGIKQDVKELVKPKPEDFESHDEYVEALTDYKVELKFQNQSNQQRQKELSAQQEEVENSFNEQMIQAEAKDPEFVKKLESGEIYIPNNQKMLDLLYGTKHLIEFGKHFGKNPADVQRIISLPIAQAAKEMVKLEATFEGPPQRTETRAPDNTAQTDGASTVINKDPADMDPDEYEAYRKEQGWIPD